MFGGPKTLSGSGVTPLSSYGAPKAPIIVSRSPALAPRVDPAAGPISGVRNSQVAVVSSVPAKLPAAALSGRRKITIQNLGPDALWIGGPTVAVGSGIELLNGDAFNEETDDAAIWYGISTGSSDARVLESAYSR